MVNSFCFEVFNSIQFNSIFILQKRGLQKNTYTTDLQIVEGHWFTVIKAEYIAYQ